MFQFIGSVIDKVILIGIGVYALLVGYRIIDPSKKSVKPEEWEKWYEKYGNILKIVGSVLTAIGIVTLLLELSK